MDICNYIFFPGDDVCSDVMKFDIIDGVIRNLEVVNGCSGNLNGIARLVETRPALEVVALMRGIKCHGHESCPNRLAEAISECLAFSETGGSDERKTL